ncbi:MAG: SDR family NAD(P)-dependent oxidoreductase [Rhodospirillales bacterium]
MNRTIFILSASSGIGQALMERYLAAGDTVIGTCRMAGALDAFADHPRAITLELDLNDPDMLNTAAATFAERGLAWDVFIACNGTMEPIGPFMTLDGADWQQTICTNALLPCRLLQALYPHRRADGVATAVFMAGGGTNNPFTNYSAYCLSKIILIKMCELLDDEAPDLKTFIVGPGYVRTKIHDETLRAGVRAGVNLDKTKAFLAGDGTPLDDIFDCIEWGTAQPRAAIGGRNISVVHDSWRADPEGLSQRLQDDGDMFKLRRQGNLQ